MMEVKRGRGRPRLALADTDVPTVQALDRGILLLQALAQHHAVSLTDLALQVGMPASSAHRLLITLQQHDFVDFDENTQLWQVGIEAFRVGSAYLFRTNLLEAARQPLRDLMEMTGETANLAVIDKAEVVFVAQVETTNPIRAFFSAGTRSLMHSSGIGKALLAQMPRPKLEALLQRSGLPKYTQQTLTTPTALYADLAATANRGWSYDQEERYDGMSCIGAAIRNAHGDLVGGISVSGPSVRFDPLQVALIGFKVKAAADQVTLTLGGKVS
jgi:IclR family acetate operon transcriptional repressor|tara:strand:- start:3450 stop:4265 length:816 start_codon:yes stop_codon:yes gene_type:complete